MAEMIRQTQAEWEAEGERRFGPDKMKWRFVCAACGHEQCAEDFRQFKDRGAEPGHAYNRCIGRYDRSIADCDWAAFGLLGTMGKGRIITSPDGDVSEIFDFAPEV